MSANHQQQAATQTADKILKGLQAEMGFVPNLFECLRDAPNVLATFMVMNQVLAQSSLSDTECDVVLLTVSRANDCAYCVAGHSTLATRSGMAPDMVRALREGKPLGMASLEALRAFAQALTEDKGHDCQAAYHRFLQAGYSIRQAQEVILAISLKTLSNTTATLFRLPLDPAFEEQRWHRLSDAA
ncbi:MAG: carboxymuconolactone decarboxylase family protein [Kiloniellales bacterium]